LFIPSQYKENTKEHDMTELPMMTVSGIRGVVGETIDELFVARIAYIQARIAGAGKIVVGRDTRPSGERFARAVFKGIRAAGGIPVDLGVAPTPTACVCTSSLQAGNGIILTASHNPIQYNGYKMVNASGRLFRGHECDRVYEEFRKGEYPSDDILMKNDDTPVEKIDGASIHIQRILPHIDITAIRSARMSIAIDSINGAAATVFPALLEKLGVKWTGVHNKLDGDFVHNPEPRPEHLTDLSDLLKRTSGLWGGFVFDPDADRLATMGEHGEEISEEMTLVFALQNLLQKARSNICTNLSTSMLIDDIAAKFGVRVFRTKIGEANVVEGMEVNGCAVGGEGNGGVIYPAISTVRDGLAGLAIILELMAKTGQKLSNLASQWPIYSIVKQKVPCGGSDPHHMIRILGASFASERTDFLDGLKIIRDYGWVHLRPSNTEPIIRCYAEARSQKQAQDLAEMVLSKMREIGVNG